MLTAIKGSADTPVRLFYPRGFAAILMKRARVPALPSIQHAIMRVPLNSTLQVREHSFRCATIMQFFNPCGDIDKTFHKLPHWKQGEVPVFVTFRMADSLPQEVLERWFSEREAFLAANSPPWDEVTEACYHGRISDALDEHLDAAHGCCALRDTRLAKIVVERLHHFEGQRYQLWSYVIMPNHVHVLLVMNENESLPDTLKGWKEVSSRMIHKQGLSELNPFWQPDYYDRLIRSPEHFETLRAYIRDNPAKANLNTGFIFWERS